MASIIDLLLAGAGTWLVGSGGFVLGRWWQRRSEAQRVRESHAEVARLLDRIARELTLEDNVARAIDPLAHGGRIALSRVLGGLRDHGGYEAVVLADDAGLVIAGIGPEEMAEMIAIEAAAFGAAGDRLRGQRQTILQTQPEKRWTLHRYFRVDGSLLSLSASRRGGTPRVEALDGALGAFQRVLTATTEDRAA